MEGRSGLLGTNEAGTDNTLPSGGIGSPAAACRPALPSLRTFLCRPRSGAAILLRGPGKVAGGPLSTCRVGRTAVLFSAWEAYGPTVPVSIARGLPAALPTTASRTGVSNAASCWFGKLRPRYVRVNLGRYPRRLSRGNCRVPRQLRRPVAGTSAFLFA